MKRSQCYPNLQRAKGLFNDNDIRQDVLNSLIKPTVEWGPALPENFRKYSIQVGLGLYCRFEVEW